MSLFLIWLTDCHFAFDLSASNLATSLRSWTDTSTFHTTSKIRPMNTMERETPRIIMGILGDSGQPVVRRQEKIRLSLGLQLASLIVYTDVNLTIYLKVVDSGPCLTPHNIKGNPALVLCHHSALHRRALVLIWEKMRVCISIRKAWIHPISSSLPTLCWDWKTIYWPLLCCQ